ncbi:unnamed protein product, partial [Adineta steineri]
ALPKPFDTLLNDFEKLMLIRCFSPNRIIFAINKYITKIMGEKYIIPPTVYFDSIFEQSTCQIPVIFILSPGSDPTNDIQKLAERKNQIRKIPTENGLTNEEQKTIRTLAMGQGQEKLALQVLHTAQHQGTWLLLQNCHLLLPFLNELEKELEISTKPHPDFRLWMTTEPIEKFPIGLLQKSYKVVIEPPSTLKLNLRSIFVNLNIQIFSDSDHPAYPCMIFILAFFHAIILDRRKYNKIGWSCTYDFNESDFRVSVDILKHYLNMNLEHGNLDIQWSTLRYLIGEVMYGGRVIDSYDRRIIRTYMKEYFGDFVFDSIQQFHFFIDITTKSLKYDYFIPEIRDFLSVKQRWLLKEANISIEPQIEYNFEKLLPNKISDLLQHNMEQSNSPIQQIDYKFLSKNVLFNQFFHYSIFRDFYLTYIDQLPLYNPPDVLGLHPNAEINYLTNTAHEIYSNMIMIQPEQYDTDYGSNKEQLILSLIDDILQQIPPKKDFNLLKQKFQQRVTPLTIVLLQEIQRFNLLTSVMWKSMNELKQALNGQINFSIQLDEINKDLYHGQIPTLWKSYTPQTKKSLANWIEQFRQRNQQYDKWIQDGELKVINLSGLHVPESYLAAIMQIAARKNQWSLDRTTFYTHMISFEKLMLIRCFSPNRIIFAINKYITKIMGEKYIITPTVYFDSIFEQSTAQIPVIFILSPGSDPTNDIQKLAERKNQIRKIPTENGLTNEEQKTIRTLAMGQGQETLALQVLHTAQHQGTWLLLQNCHLLLPFLNELEKELEILTKPHPDFRLWMTTEPIEKFPIGLLQKSYKVVIEPPSTLKLNLRSIFVNLNIQIFSDSDHPAYPCMIFILAFFHAIILDRRKYNKIGWSCTYDFNESDFRVSVDILKHYLNMNLEHGNLDIQWSTLRYLIGEVMYGGRVIDSYDRRIIHTYMKEYFRYFVFDSVQQFHFFIDITTKPLKYDYFIPEIRDFLSAKQRWLLKEANISIEPQIEYNFEKLLPNKISDLLQHNMEQSNSPIKQIDYKFLSKNVLFNQFFHYSIFRDFYLTYIDQLPLYNPPDVLGLHPNAEINYLTKT